MKVRNGKRTVTLRAVEIGSNHEDMPFIESADICLDGKKIGTYSEGYMSGYPAADIEKERDVLQRIAEAYCSTFPHGFLGDGPKDTSMSELYKGEEIEGFLSDMAMNQAYIEPEIKKILKRDPIAVITKDTENSVEKYWALEGEAAMESLTGKIILLKAKKGKDAFDVTVRRHRKQKGDL